MVDSVKSGNGIPVENKKVQSRYQAFCFEVETGKTYELLIHSRNVEQQFSSRFFLELSDENTFLKQNDSQLIQLGLISGCLLFVGCFSMFLFFYSKQFIFAFYGAFVLLLFVYFASSHGILTQFLEHQSFLASHRMHTVSSVGGFVFHLLYMGKFLKIKNYGLTFLPFAQYAVIAFFCFHILMVSLSESSPIPDFTVHSLFGLSVIILLGIGLLRKQKEAFLYLLASGPVLIFYIAITLANLKIIPIAKGIFYNFNIPILFEALGLGGGLLYIFIIERRKMQKELIDNQIKTVEKVIFAQENERATIASDLHDDLGGTLSFLQREFNDINIRFKGKYSSLYHLIEKAVQDLRLISHRMLPVFFEQNGFLKSLQYDIELINHKQQVQVKLIIDGEERRFEKENELHCYRIVKELINNALKHSQATEIIVQILYQKSLLYLSVEDNGIGYENNTMKDGVGLANAKLRCELLKTNLVIESNSMGTLMAVEIPNSHE